MNTKTIVYISATTIVVLAVGAVLALSLRSDRTITPAPTASEKHSRPSRELKPSAETIDNDAVSDAEVQKLPDISGRVIAVKGADNITILDSVHHNPVKIRLRGISLPPEVKEKKATSSANAKKGVSGAGGDGNSREENSDARKQLKSKDSAEEQARIALSKMVLGADIEIRSCAAEEEGSEYALGGLLFRNDQNITLEMLRSKAVDYNAADLAYLPEDARGVYENFAAAKEVVLKENPEESDASPAGPANKVSLAGKNDKSQKNDKPKSRLKNKEEDKELKNKAAKEDKPVEMPKPPTVKPVRRMENNIKVVAPR
jgi:hypothetical protein